MRGEFDHPVVEYAQGKPLERDCRGQLPQEWRDRSQPAAPAAETEELDKLPFATRHL